MSKVHDISLTITSGFPVWPGDVPVKLERSLKMEEGSEYNLSRMEIGVHTGTHMDAPYHFINDKSTIESLPLDVLVGRAQVVQLPDSCGLITAEAIRTSSFQPGMERVLFKTRNSSFWKQTPLKFREDFTAINSDGAEYLVKHGVRLVGIDYLSIAPFNDSVAPHLVLLGAGVVLLEGTDLSGVAPGFYTLCALPMKLGGSDGAPTRAVLIED